MTSNKTVRIHKTDLRINIDLHDLLKTLFYINSELWFYEIIITNRMILKDFCCIFFCILTSQSSNYFIKGHFLTLQIFETLIINNGRGLLPQILIFLHWSKSVRVYICVLGGGVSLLKNSFFIWGFFFRFKKSGAYWHPLSLVLPCKYLNTLRLTEMH